MVSDFRSAHKDREPDTGVFLKWGVVWRKAQGLGSGKGKGSEKT